jgi:hypothetical protein
MEKIDVKNQTYSLSLIVYCRRWMVQANKLSSSLSRVLYIVTHVHVISSLHDPKHRQG